MQERKLAERQQERLGDEPEGVCCYRQRAEEHGRRREERHLGEGEHDRGQELLEEQDEERRHLEEEDHWHEAWERWGVSVKNRDHEQRVDEEHHEEDNQAYRKAGEDLGRAQERGAYRALADLGNGGVGASYLVDHSPSCRDLEGGNQVLEDSRWDH